MKGIAHTLSTDQSFIADKVNAITANWAGLQILSDDFISLNSKIDKLLHITEVLGEGSSSLLERTRELSSRLGGMAASVDDLRTTLAGSDLASPSSGHSAESIIPVIDDIRRGVRHVKGALGSCSEAVNKNCELIGAIASDVRTLASRDALVSSYHLPGGAVATAGLDASVAESIPLAELRPPQRHSTSATPSQVFIPQQRPKQPEDRRHRRRRGQASPQPSTIIGDPNNSHPVAAQHAADIDVGVQQAAEGEASGGSCSVSVRRTPDVGAAIGSVELSPSADAGGTVDAVTLRPAVLPRSVFVSRVHPDTTVDDIVHHISSHFGVSRDGVNCRRIDKSRNGAVSFFASFKIVIPDALFNAIVSPEIWPNGAIVREFTSRNHPGSRVTPKNSLMKLQSTTLM